MVNSADALSSTAKWVASLALVAALILLPRWATGYFVISVTDILMYLILTVGWAAFCGRTQYISLASAAFFGVGIYTTAAWGQSLSVPGAIVLAGLLSGLLAFGVGLTSLRLRGMYFTIFTFGLSELIRHAVLWWEVNVTGTVGRLVLPVDDTTVYYVMLGIALATVLTSYIIGVSKYGLALAAIGQSEEAADHAGINVNRVKIVAFSVTSLFMGCAGAIMATRWTYIDPEVAFNPLYSFMPVLMATFGGIQSLFGQILGAAALTVLADILLTRFPYYYNLIYGLALILVIMFLPRGLKSLPDLFRGLEARPGSAK